LRYLLDTNACIGLINESPALVRSRFEKARAKGSTTHISSIALFELWYGVCKSRRKEYNTQLLTGFLSGPIDLLAFESEDARVAGALRAELESRGGPIGGYDLLIAGQALRHKMTLVTANAREFGRIRDLSWEDWSKA
jgi:tRNA(fMet)-specific endonuclease VapC